MLQTTRDFQYMTLRKCWTIDLPHLTSMFAASAVHTTFLTMLQFKILKKILSWPICLILSASINRFQSNIMKHVRTCKFPFNHFQVMVTSLPNSARNNVQSKYFSRTQQPPVGQGLLTIKALRSHTQTTLGRTLLGERTARRRDLYLTTHKSQQTSNRRDSNSQSQNDSVRRCTPWTAWPLQLAI